MRFQVVNGKNPFEAGLMLLPMLAATALGSLIAGAVNGKVHKTAETMALGAALMLLGCALETTAGTGVVVEGKILGFLVFVGVGFGLVAAGGTMSGIYSSPAREHGEFFSFYRYPCPRGRGKTRLWIPVFAVAAGGKGVLGPG
jgi:fucose permease